ncbi:hypothetical protein STRCR_1135 [Streptococcus criceti HS-6]|uniref:Uncharacterized protein n=1 Tax=Streptococcus criceti HS-6 TaxID=873449 RepID=G5JTN8_STRCG|nr:hypothetical protein STRCR_1135 [Streptococcus criceti HS-6]
MQGDQASLNNISELTAVLDISNVTENTTKPSICRQWCNS